jgi:hypothetical protein
MENINNENNSNDNKSDEMNAKVISIIESNESKLKSKFKVSVNNFFDLNDWFESQSFYIGLNTRCYVGIQTNDTNDGINYLSIYLYLDYWTDSSFVANCMLSIVNDCNQLENTINRV